MFDRLCLLWYGAIFTWALSPVANTSWFSFTEHAVQCREALTPREMLLPKLLAALWTREKFLTRVSSEQKGLHISKWTVGSTSSLKLCQQLLLKWWIDLLISDSWDTPWVQSVLLTAPETSLRPLFYLNLRTLLTDSETCLVAPRLLLHFISVFLHHCLNPSLYMQKSRLVHTVQNIFLFDFPQSSLKAPC